LLGAAGASAGAASLAAVPVLAVDGFDVVAGFFCCAMMPLVKSNMSRNKLYCFMIG
jgi:hypothetical protein